MPECERDPSEMLNRSAERYRLAGQHIISMLNRRLEQSIPQPTGSAIESAMVLACYTDNVLDSALVGSSADYRRLLDQTVGFLWPDEEPKDLPDIYAPCAADAWNLQRYLEKHDTEGRQAMKSDFALYRQLGQELREARTPRLYAAITRLEGRVAMRGVLHLLPSDIRLDPANKETIAWFIRLGQLGNMYDSLADSSTDVRSGRARAGSPFRLRISLAKAALQDIGPVARELSPREWLAETKDFVGVLRGTHK